jgi:hypothetical protein
LSDSAFGLSKGELALAALRRGAEKAQRQEVVTEHDLDELREQLESAGCLASVSDDFNEEWESVLHGDPNLAIALVRAHLERRLRRLLPEASQPKDLQQVLLVLVKGGVLNHRQIEVLSKAFTILNSAVHGAVIDRAASKWAHEVGSRILAKPPDVI